MRSNRLWHSEDDRRSVFRGEDESRVRRSVLHSSAASLDAAIRLFSSFQPGIDGALDTGVWMQK